MIKTDHKKGRKLLESKKQTSFKILQKTALVIAISLSSIGIVFSHPIDKSIDSTLNQSIKSTLDQSTRIKFNKSLKTSFEQSKNNLFSINNNKFFDQKTSNNKKITTTIKNGTFEIDELGEMTYKIQKGSQVLKIKESFDQEKDLTQKQIINNNKIELGEIKKGFNATLQKNNSNIEKIISIQPNSDPNQIKLKLKGHNTLKINNKGELIIFKNDQTTIKFSKPIAFQIIENSKIEIDVKYQIINENTYGFEIGDYNTNYELIIDPILYSTFIGGENTNEENSKEETSAKTLIISTDPADNKKYIYIVGHTEVHGDFKAPFVPPAEKNERGDKDIFIVKLPLNLNEITASALIGGNGTDTNPSITADESGNIYIYFQTNSTNIQTTVSSYQETLNGEKDIAIIKLPPTLDSILTSTYLGGSGTDTPANIETKNGYIYITGTTTSIDEQNTFPTGPKTGENEVYNHENIFYGTQTFISKLNNDLNKSYYIGTYFPSGVENPAIKIYSTDTNHENDKIFLTGITKGGIEIIDEENAYQSLFQEGFNNIIIARLNSKLTTLEASTYLSNESNSNSTGSINIYKDSQNSESEPQIIITNDLSNGESFFNELRTDGNNKRYDYDENSNNDILNSCNGDDIFIGNFNYDLTEASVAVICGNNDENHTRSEIDEEGNIYVITNTNSTNFPTTQNGFQQHYSGNTDTAIVKLPLSLSEIKSSTYLGGTDGADNFAKGIAIDSDKLYISGLTNSKDFPTTTATVRAFKTNSDSDYFVTVLTEEINSPCAPLLFNEDPDDEGPIESIAEMCFGIRIQPTPPFFEKVPESFNFPTKYTATTDQNSFSASEISEENLLIIRDLSGEGSFDITIQATELTNGFDNIDLSNLYIVTSAPKEEVLNQIDSDLTGITTNQQITFAEGSIGQNIQAPVGTNENISYPSTYFSKGKSFDKGPVTIMSSPRSEHYLRASQGISFFLNIPAETPSGTYSTIFTLDLIQN